MAEAMLEFENAGFSCQDCDFRSRFLFIMNRHCEKDHTEKENLAAKIEPKTEDFEDFAEKIVEIDDFDEEIEEIDDLGETVQEAFDIGETIEKMDDFGEKIEEIEDLGEKMQDFDNFGQETDDFGGKKYAIGDIIQEYDHFGEEIPMNIEADPTYFLENSFSEDKENQPMKKVSQRNKKNVLSCQLCGANFSRIQNLHRHVRRVHTSMTRYTCLNCDYMGDQFKMITNHSKKWHGIITEVKCSYCDFQSNSAKKLAFHFRLRHENMDPSSKYFGKTPETPNLPEKIIKNNDIVVDFNQGEKGKSNENFENICLSDDDEAIFSPDNFEKSSGDFRGFESESIVKLTPKKFLCSICDYSEDKSIDIRIHMKNIHFGETLIRCSKCHFTSKDVLQMEKHYKQLHLLKKKSRTNSEQKCIRNSEQNFECKICQKSLDNILKLRRHIRVAHIDVKRFKCSSCLFSNDEALKIVSHSRAKHNKMDKICCSFCNFATKNKSLLSTHYFKFHYENHVPESLRIELEPFTNHEDSKPKIETTWKIQIEDSINIRLPSDDINDKLECKVCLKIFKSNIAIKIHQKYFDHSSNTFNCTSCSFKAIHHKELSSHLKFHRTESNNRVLKLILTDLADKYDFIKLVPNYW